MSAIRKSIFDIQEEYLELVYILEEAGGEVTPELEEALKINKDELEAKVTAYRSVIKINQSNIGAVEAEIERLSDLKKSYENTIKKLKEVLLEATKLYGHKGKSGNFKLDFPTFKMWTGGRDSVEITIPHLIPEKYHKYTIIGNLNADQKTVIQAALPLTKFNVDYSKTAILADLKQDVVIEGAHIKNSEFITVK